jgi:rhamnose utilization protein RhaD (predicted bifunctional aldolase and dehydrogenase)/NAD(P)-dependent dehydrogenase (short-subunit alcohol dehydrogenase family)
MISRYADTDAAAHVAAYGPAWGEDLALRIYTSRLLGRDPALVLHGGGNTSVKTTARDLTGDDVEVLCVKGSGWDLAGIEPRGFPACRVAPLLRFAARDAMSDEEMVAGLRGQMLDPSSPTPSVEALLHAVLPGKFVDHTHADAVLTIQDQPDARAIAAEVWGGDFVFVPYVMPGFALARAVAALVGELGGAHGLILEQHGIFTWGGTARDAYERMIAGVHRAEEWRRERRPAFAVRAASGSEDQRRRLQALVAPVIRGACARAEGGLRLIGEWRDDEDVLALAGRPDGPELTARGPVTPDHVIRTRPRPMWLTVGADTSTDALRTAADAAVAAHAAWYRGYYDRGSAALGRALVPLDPMPRIVYVPGAGALALGRTIADARVAGDICARSARVIQDAEAAGRYHPVGERDLFEVEYWSLEQAKLATGGRPGPLAGQVALVTGGAGGLGLAIAGHLLRLGAHVMLTDLASPALDAAREALAREAGPRVGSAACDVTASESVAAAVAAAVREFGGVDILVSNAGTAPSGLLHTEEGEARLAASLDVNLLGHQRMARAVTQVLLAQGTGGCLLFNASKSAVNPGPEFGPYAIAKAGVLALMRQCAVDLGAHGIRSNAVNADRVRTGLFAGGVLEARARARGISADEYFRQNLLQRETTMEDVAAAFGWLAAAPATTGCVITVDGGNAAAFLR